MLFYGKEVLLMINEVNKILMEFHSCFSRKAAFNWFVFFVFGFLTRLDHHGASSMIRWLAINPNLYSTSLNFFRATSWDLQDLQRCWLKIILKHCPATTICGYLVLVGDGIKIVKESKNMPGVKKIHQESDNSGKAPYIYGHHFGVLGILVGRLKKLFCIPVAAEIHEGMEEIRKFQGKEAPQEKSSITTLMGLLVKNIVSQLNTKCLVVLDAFYSVGPIFREVRSAVDDEGNRMIEIVTKAKKNIVGYLDPPPRKKGQRGRSRKYGDKIKLMSLFSSRAGDFQETTLDLYGQKKTVSYLCIDLIWKPIKDKLRFVLVIDGTEKFILISSNLTMDPTQIILAYSYRFKIEVSFKMLKRLIGAFCYHFWTTAWPKIGKVSSDLSTITSNAEKELISLATEAIERFVNLGCIALGILQILALNNCSTIWKKYRGWLRTYSSEVPSEETVRSIIQNDYYHNFEDFSHTGIFKILEKKKKGQEEENNMEVA